MKTFAVLAYWGCGSVDGLRLKWPDANLPPTLRWLRLVNSPALWEVS